VKHTNILTIFTRLFDRPDRTMLWSVHRHSDQLPEQNLFPAVAGTGIWRDLFVSFGMVIGLLALSRARFHLERVHWGFMVLYGLTLAIFNSCGPSLFNTTARRRQR